MFVRRYLQPDIDVIELGGSVGAVSTNIARKVYTDRLMVSVDANSRLCPVIEENISLNAPDAKVVLLNAAVSYEGSRAVNFGVSYRNTDSSVLAI